MTRLTTLETNLKSILGEDADLTRALGELTLQVPADQWIDTCRTLRDEADLRFETCIDLCAVDYSGWRTPTYTEAAQQFPQRFAVVIHLLSLTHNRSEEHTSELQSRGHLVCRLLLEKKK